MPHHKGSTNSPGHTTVMMLPSNSWPYYLLASTTLLQPTSPPIEYLLPSGLYQANCNFTRVPCTVTRLVSPAVTRSG